MDKLNAPKKIKEESFGCYQVRLTQYPPSEMYPRGKWEIAETIFFPGESEAMEHYDVAETAEDGDRLYKQVRELQALRYDIYEREEDEETEY